MEIEVTVLLPCLSEAETVAKCVELAKESLRVAGLCGEVLVADICSTDDSVAAATEAGARVIHVSRKDYGAALRGGIDEARGEIVVMADADLSYNLGDVPKFVAEVRRGADLVVGDRFAGASSAARCRLRTACSATPYSVRSVGT
jgi:glycosyltransferase involved in cell wall biosynthesis